MDPVQFEGQTLVLQPPPDSPPGECDVLAIRRVFPETSAGCALQSYWRPTPEEVAQLNAGAHVRLTVHGTGHPPVWIDVERVEEKA